VEPAGGRRPVFPLKETGEKKKAKKGKTKVLKGEEKTEKKKVTRQKRL